MATRLDIPVVLVCNGGIRPPRNPLVSLRIVPEGPDVADQWIAAHCGAGDVVVTGDIPLADRCLKAGALPGRTRLAPSGRSARVSVEVMVRARP